MDELVEKLELVLDNFRSTFDAEVEDVEVAFAGQELAQAAEAVVSWWMDNGPVRSELEENQ